MRILFWRGRKAKPRNDPELPPATAARLDGLSDHLLRDIGLRRDGEGLHKILMR